MASKNPPVSSVRKYPLMLDIFSNVWIPKTNYTELDAQYVVETRERSSQWREIGYSTDRWRGKTLSSTQHFFQFMCTGFTPNWAPSSTPDNRSIIVSNFVSIYFKQKTSFFQCICQNGLSVFLLRIYGSSGPMTGQTRYWPPGKRVFRAVSIL